MRRQLIIDLETSALTPDIGDIIRFRAENIADPEDAFDEWAMPALSGKLSQAALKPDAENSCRCGGRGGPLGKSCRSEVAHCFPGSEVALDGEGVVDRGVG